MATSKFRLVKDRPGHVLPNGGPRLDCNAEPLLDLDEDGVLWMYCEFSSWQERIRLPMPVKRLSNYKGAHGQLCPAARNETKRWRDDA